ncbi:MAG TPA: phenylalanine--tRNA ligase subunit alpha [Myxococcales bacterium]|jgi:phenylalanyl-tRNA synthetase alpha chain|nr:phenylalanine--tRNA ligase subunit alpha [Myxococcales bacterium]
MGNKEQEAIPLPDEVQKELESVRAAASADFQAAPDTQALEAARVAHLGMKGAVTKLFDRIPSLPKEQRRLFGQQANALRAELERALEERQKGLEHEALERELKGERLDVTLPGRRQHLGRRHPVSRTMDDISAIFTRLGFEVAQGPEIEHDFFNFEALNIPPDHPARDMQDTFWVQKETLGPAPEGSQESFKVDPGTLGQPGPTEGTVVLRTHTSPVQIRTMLGRKPPVRIIAPGKVYRCDSDVTHTPMFHQVEGLLVDKGVTFAELKGTLGAFVRALFGGDTKTRFRPSYFPFTEPSAEIDISCVHCKGAGCRICKLTGWLEILGAGMVHPNVFRAVGYDPAEVSGFAFGLGVERIAMLRYGVDDLRSFFENDARFLEQF